MKKKVSKKIKLWRVFRRKLLKPIGIACLISFMIYLIVGNIIFYKKPLQNLQTSAIITCNVHADGDGRAARLQRAGGW